MRRIFAKNSRTKGSKSFLQQGGCGIKKTHECQYSHNSNMASENSQPVKSFSEFLENCRHEKCNFDERMVHWFFMHVLYNIYADDWEKLVDVFTRPDVKKIDELCKYLNAKGIDAGTICTFIHKMEDDRPIGIEVSYSNEMKAFAGDFIIYKRK